MKLTEQQKFAIRSAEEVLLTKGYEAFLAWMQKNKERRALVIAGLKARKAVR